jgi:chromosome segregation ATPase
MQVINESLKTENKDLLPQILMRIFSVCKADPNFPLKEQINSIERDMSGLQKKINHQNELLEQTLNLRDDLSNRLQSLRQSNFELKSRLLEELGSDI